MLKELINETNCKEEYNKVSELLNDKLDDVLKEVVKFYYNDFWISRFRRRLNEERIDFNPIKLDCILGMISYLRDDSEFKIFNESEDQNGRSDNGTMIALNSNMSDGNDSHIKNIVMHEFGHRQYNQSEFKIVKLLNEIVMDIPGSYIKDNQTVGEKDYSYFTDYNELRQRIIPIVKEMFDNNWSSEEAYELSNNLRKDDIRNIFKKEYIIYLLLNIL